MSNLDKLLEVCDKAELNERWEELEGGTFFGTAHFTVSLSDLITKLNTIPNQGWRILYDNKKGYIFLCNAGDAIHNDMLKSGIEMGLYYPEIKAAWEMDGYIYDSVDDDQNYLFYIVVMPDDKNPGDEMSDGYLDQYIYKNFTIYTRDCDFTECPLYKHFEKDLVKYNKLSW